MTKAPADTKTVIVAVHGIGDQTRNATVQSVAGRFASSGADQVALPVGYFRGPNPNQAEVKRLDWPHRRGNLAQPWGYVEVYWGDLPQEAVKDAHSLELTQAWASTVVERLGALSVGPNGLSMADVQRAKRTFMTMIETIDVLEFLLMLFRKIGVFDFELRRVLAEFLGDVQLVTEFADYRTKILACVRRTLDDAFAQCKGADIHIVAHSEGTVIAFMGLLAAFADGAPWAEKVRGFMTLGSPIDKHLVLWPEIWAPWLIPPTIPAAAEWKPIEWCNYYDFADPVGFDLDTARLFLGVTGWRSHFDFTNRTDFGFSRYILPGAAHNEYWDDAAVFDDFINHVLMGNRRAPLSAAQAANLEKADVPSRSGRAFLSTTIPYFVCAGTLVAGVMVIYSSLIHFLDLKASGWVVLGNSLAIACLLGGMTLAVRVPRLVKERLWHWLAWALFIGSLFVYRFGVSEEARQKLGTIFALWKS